MTWLVWAVISSLCAAALAESNRIFKLNAQMLNAWRSTIALVLMAATIPYMQWPDTRSFYTVAIIDGIVTAIGMVMFFYLAAKKTGRVSSMILPMAAFAAYMTWWMMRPLERPDLTENPFQVLLAVLSFVIVCFSFQKLRDNDSGWDSFLIVLPVGLSFGVIDALTKDVLETEGNIYQMILSYTFLSLLTCTVTAWIAAIPKPLGGRPTGFWNGYLLWGSFWCGIWTVGMVLCGAFALSLAPNPSLPGLVMVLTPLWLFALNFIRKVEDDVSIPASLLILIGSAGLLISTL
jgi:hypothetical protein